jgi:Cu2+-exporting ATPase
MLLEAGILLATYSGLRLFEKLREKPSKKGRIKPNKKPQPSSLEKHNKETDKTLVVNDKADQQLEHRLKTSVVLVGLSALRFFYPLLALLNLSLYIYNSVPPMKKSEKLLFQKRKINMEVFETMLIIASLATNQYFAGAFTQMTYYLSTKIKAKTQDKSKDMLMNVFDQQPRTLWILKNNVEIEVPLETVQVNDIVVVNTGEVVPVDGIITDGMATIDQHALTGESQPAEKGVSNPVLATTIVMTDRIYVKVDKTGIDTTISKIGHILDRTTDFKTTMQLKGEKWADQAVFPQLGVLSVALMTVGPMGAAAVLNTNFGYRLRLIGSLGTLNHLNLASHQGILIKDGRSLELLTQIDTVLFDKTGTLTQEQPEVGKIIICDDYEEDEILMYAAAAERKLAHPIAKTILQKADDSNLIIPDIEESSYQMGYGITVNIKNQVIKVGSSRFMTREGITIPETIEKAMDHSHNQGHTLVMVAINHQIKGAIEIQPVIRQEVKEIISGLRQRGIKYLAIVSGDHKHPTQKLAEKLGMDGYFHEILPEQKANIVEKLQKEGKSVCFIGDGINDAIAIKKANVSISLSGATSIATDLAQIVLMDGSLSHLCELFDIATGFDKQLRKSLIISIAPLPINMIGIFLLHFGIFSTILINQTAFWSGIGDAMLPLRKSEHKKTGQVFKT